MFTQNEYVAIRLNKDAYDRAYNEVNTLRQLRQAGLLKPSKMTIFACKGLAFLGHWMVSAGKRLERVDGGSALPPADFKAAQAD